MSETNVACIDLVGRRKPKSIVLTILIGGRKSMHLGCHSDGNVRIAAPCCMTWKKVFR